MKVLIVGSVALKYWFLDFNRIPKDLDVIGDASLLDNFEKLRIEKLENPILLEYYKGGSVYLPPNYLYTLKMSHIFWDINWDKHMWDLQFLRGKGCVLDKELFYKLYDYWNIVHSKNKRSDLKMTSSQFFNNAIKFPVEHDFLHTLLTPIPTFNKVLKDGEEVEVDEQKFLSLSEEEKENLVREEIYVMATERMYTLHYKQAYNIMLKKFLLSHAPLWEAIWMVENYIKLSKCNFNFIEFLKNKINETGINIA